MNLDKEQQRLKDSLEKAKEKIDRQLEKLDSKAGEPNTVVSYSLPAYNPMLILN